MTLIEVYSDIIHWDKYIFGLDLKNFFRIGLLKELLIILQFVTIGYSERLSISRKWNVFIFVHTKFGISQNTPQFSPARESVFVNMFV